jgi:hypothetical protein
MALADQVAAYNRSAHAPDEIATVDGRDVVIDIPLTVARVVDDHTARVVAWSCRDSRVQVDLQNGTDVPDEQRAAAACVYSDSGASTIDRRRRLPTS